MLSEEQLEIISETITPLFQYLEKEVIADIARRIAKTLTYSRTAELQAIAMMKMGYSPAKIRKEAMKMLNADPDFRKAVAKNTLEYKREVRKIINDITRAAYKANEEIVAGAGNMSWANDLSVWKEAGKDLTDNSYLKELVDSFAAQTAGELKNMTQTTGFKVMSGCEGIENAYRRELDKAVIKICSGTFSQDKVVRDVVHDLAQSGLRSIDFASGYSMQLDTAARLAIRTGCHQLAGKVQDKNIEQTGENLVYVSKHWGARNTGTGHANHEQWQGRVYYIKEGKDYSEEAKRIGQDYITDLWRATGYSVDGAHESDPTGLYGYNCRHRHYVWFEGASSLPKEQAEPKPVTINGKTYDYYAMTQKMRSMERNIRALKREKEALTALGDDTTEINAKIRQKTTEYRDFCKTCGVPEQTSRLRYECGTADLKKTKAWKGFEVSVAPTKEIVAKEKINKKLEIPSKEFAKEGMSEEQISEIQKGVKDITSEYNVQLDAVRLANQEESSNNFGVPMYYSVLDDNSRVLIINQQHEMWKDEDTFWGMVDKRKFTSARNIREAVWHEMAHAITYSKCTTVEECVILDRRLRDKYVPGISRYNDISQDGSETIAEAFVKMRKRLKVPDEARKLVEEYVEVQRKW